MKIIISRKGFDAQNGGMASPIMPDGTMLSFPIPQDDFDTYDGIYYRDKSYMDIWRELKPRQKIFPDMCHVDPDIRPRIRKHANIPKWTPIFGQVGAAQSHLENEGVEVGDIFLFFGWFRQTEEIDGKLQFCKDSPDVHALYGYLQIGKSVTGYDVQDYPWHPHSEYAPESNNTMYIAPKQLKIDGKDTGFPGAGVFRYTDDVILTKPGMSRSKWDLPDFFKEVAISRHDETCFKPEGYFQTVGIGQEFVISEDIRVTNWATRIIESSIDLRK